MKVDATAGVTFADGGVGIKVPIPSTTMGVVSLVGASEEISWVGLLSVKGEFDMIIKSRNSFKNVRQTMSNLENQHYKHQGTRMLSLNEFALSRCA